MPPPLIHSRVAAAVLLVLGSAAALCAAPPANDSITSAFTLDSDVPDQNGTTVDATVEASEPLPPGYDSSSYQGTVWWQWTPVFSGWYEINSAGSAVDTVLSVWTDNNGAGPLTLIHVNDEATEGSVSRIRFLADSSVTYKIAVASRTAARGAVTLTAYMATTPISRVITASFSPATVDVTASSVNVTADVTLNSTPSFQTGQISLYGPTNNVLSTAIASAANRISGNQASGVYRMILSVPHGSSAGTCRWGIRMTDMAGTIDSSYGREGMTPLPPGVPESTTVIQPPAGDPYTAWAASYSLSGDDALRTTDPDHDGTNNWMEYQNGLHPGQGLVPQLLVSGGTIVTMGLPHISVVDASDQMRLRVVFLRRLNDTSARTTVQFSDDLSVWTNASQVPAVIATNATHEALIVEDEVVVPAKARRYARVCYEWLP